MKQKNHFEFLYEVVFFALCLLIEILAGHFSSVKKVYFNL